MSREHAEFERRWDGVFVRDLNSKNGVLCMGERLAAEQRLADGDVLRLGQTSFRLEDPEDRYLRQMEEVEAGAGQSDQAGAGAEAAAAGDSDIQAGRAVLPDTHTLSAHVSSQAALPSQDASSRPAPVEHARRLPRHGPLAFMVIAAVVLLGVIAFALSFLLGS
jgi:predicted component of type VI protein secretion system